MQYTLIDHDKFTLAVDHGNRAIIQFENHEAAQAAFEILLDKLSFETNRVQYILGRSIIINRLSDKEYDKMLRVLKRAK
jgi:hypothetical protein